MTGPIVLALAVAIVAGLMRAWVLADRYADERRRVREQYADDAYWAALVSAVEVARADFRRLEVVK